MRNPGNLSRADGRVRSRTDFLWLGAACVVLSCAGFVPRLAGQSLSGETAAPTSIHGTVLNHITNEPIGRALVYSSDEMYAAFTDDRGHFEFKFPPPDTPKSGEGLSGAESSASQGPQYVQNERPSSFLARKPGYLAGGSFERASGGEQESGLSAPSSEMTIFLEPEALIVGHLQFGSADSMTRIRVNLCQSSVVEGQEKWLCQRQFTSWANGEFRFDQLTRGTYKLLTTEQMDRDSITLDPRGQLYGYPPVFYLNAASLADAIPIHLGEGETFQAILSPKRRPYYSVEIGVINIPKGGGPQVMVYPQGHPGPGYSLSYDPNEEMIGGSLPDGNYTLRVTTFGEHRATGEANFTVRGGPVAGMRMSLNPNVSLSVNVKEEITPGQEPAHEGEIGMSDGNGGIKFVRQPPQIQLVAVEDFGWNPGANSHRAMDGSDSLILDEVQPGRYWVNVRAGRGGAMPHPWYGVVRTCCDSRW